MKKQVILLSAVLALSASATLPVAADNSANNSYTNPIERTSLPDPTIIKADDGYYYLYATESIRNLPIYKSKDLVDWTYVGTAFTPETRPQMVPKGGLWAPDINRIGNKYVLYYAKSQWGGEWSCGIGVATADQPQGPFTDHGKLFLSNEIGVQNSIDPFYIDDNGHKYLFWGSFRGIYGIELSADGLSVKPGADKFKIAGTQMEATYIHKRDGYYYLFGSAGTCCDGAKSTYRVIVGRSTSLFGPYLTPDGKSMLEDDAIHVILHGNRRVVGPGHNAEIITDDAGTDWLFYHGFMRRDLHAGRVLWMDPIVWVNGWPTIKDGVPSKGGARPVIR